MRVELSYKIIQMIKNNYKANSEAVDDKLQ